MLTPSSQRPDMQSGCSNRAPLDVRQLPGRGAARILLWQSCHLVLSSHPYPLPEGAWQSSCLTSSLRVKLRGEH